MLNKTITSFKDEAGHLSILMLPKLPILKDYKGLNGQPLPQPGQPCPQPGGRTLTLKARFFIKYRCYGYLDILQTVKTTFFQCRFCG